MTTEPTWLSRSIIDAIHESLVSQFGGSNGVRDDGLLESALDRARNRWGYDETADIADLAASYGVGVAKNHAFVDGNKRSAFQAMYVFLTRGVAEIRRDVETQEGTTSLFAISRLAAATISSIRLHDRPHASTR